jgi:HSP20 family protein
MKMKTVTLYRPYTIEKALDDFDRYMESFFGESPLTPAHGRVNYLPPVNIEETNGAYLLEAELPGFDEKNIEVQVDGGVLTIKSAQGKEVRKELPETAKEDESAQKEPERQFLIRERRSESFSRSFKLPENADPDSISAVFKNGLLNLEIAKRPETQKRLIKIG